MYTWIYFFTICSIYSIIKKPMSAIASSHPVQWAHYLSLGKESRTDLEAGFDLNEEDMRKFHIWPLGIIPYYIDDFSFDKVLRDRIRHHLDNINRVTGLRFLEIPRPPEDDQSRWVFFLNRNGRQDCADIAFKNFTIEGVQRIVLGYNCLSGRNIAEIVLSLVGVPPQHNAPNRDEIIIIEKDNILPDKLYLFDVLKDNEWLFHKMKYDLESAGHYHPHQYTQNGAATITFKQPEALTPHYLISRPSELSATDIQKIKSLYNYISRNRETPSRVPGCNKLFEVGSSLHSIKPKEEKNKILKKPKQYLGVNASDENDVSKEDGESIESSMSKESKVSKEVTSSEVHNTTEKTHESEENKKLKQENSSREINRSEKDVKKPDTINSSSNESVNVSKSIVNKKTTRSRNSKLINITRDKNLSYLHKMKKQYLLDQLDYRTSDERS